jgi:hypothetical protein
MGETTIKSMLLGFSVAMTANFGFAESRALQSDGGSGSSESSPA